MPMEPYLLSDRGLLQSIGNCKKRLATHKQEQGPCPVGSADKKRRNLERDLRLAETELAQRKLKSSTEET